MRRILITSGPTREYLDPVRFLTNASSGRMGAALAQAVLSQGDLPVIVSGRVEIAYPDAAEVHWTETTEEMLRCCIKLFPQCSGVIGAAAPCDFIPVVFSPKKLQKSADGGGMTVCFRETPDILATLGQMKRQDQWSIGFALETAGFQNGGKEHALEKLQKKNCRLIVLNTPDSISKSGATFQVFDAAGALRLNFTGTKAALAEELLSLLANSPLLSAEPPQNGLADFGKPALTFLQRTHDD